MWFWCNKSIFIKNYHVCKNIHLHSKKFLTWVWLRNNDETFYSTEIDEIIYSYEMTNLLCVHYLFIFLKNVGCGNRTWI